MAELVDAADLKSVDHCDRGSSSLPTPITFIKNIRISCVTLTITLPLRQAYALNYLRQAYG